MVSGVVAQGCATSGPPAPTGPVELDGTRWKLVALGGALDGRVVQFEKKGQDAYIGKLVDVGRRLRSVVGLEPGFELFRVKKKGENEYDGIYKAVDPSGAMPEKEVVLFINGNSMTWNQESAVWERQ